MDDPRTRSERGWAIARIALGQAQIGAALVSLVCLVQTGMSSLTVWALTVTCVLLLTSVLLFRGGGEKG